MKNDVFFDKQYLSDLLLESVSEKKRTRRWNIFFRFFFICIFFFMCFFIAKNSYYNRNIDHIAVIEISGIISDASVSNAKAIVKSLNDAFFNKHVKGIILKINSPGGTPVQANIIHNHIKKLRKVKNDKPIYAVIEDIGTSGAYLVAIAAEKIYCDPSSIVGSIGVLVNSFGFVGIMNKLGIERRIYKSGKNKVMLDPFSERNFADENFLQHNLDIVHKNFIDLVKKNRYNNDISCDEEIFSGKYWIGQDALELGLVDGFYDVYTLASEILKLDLLVDYNFKSGILNIMDKDY